jgi:glycogen debranching enzyme
MEKDTNKRTNVQMKFYDLEEGGKFQVDEGGNVRVSKCSLTKEFQREFLGKLLNTPDPSLESNKEKLITDDIGGYSTFISIKVDGKVALEAESRYGKSALVYNPELLNQVIEKAKEMEIPSEPGKFILKDGDIVKQINTNEDVLKHFEKYDSANQIATWRENGKIKTQADFHFLDNEMPERVAAVLNQEYGTKVEVKDDAPEISLKQDVQEQKTVTDIEL